MKHIILLVSLILLGLLAPKEIYKEQPSLADPNNPLSLTCPEYIPTEHSVNANPNFANPYAGLNDIDQNWYSAAVDNILKEEYNISYSEELKSYQSSNRANNILFTYQNSGFTAKTMQTKIPLFDVNDKMLREADKNYNTIEDWSVELLINNSKLFSAGNRARLENEKISIDYTNTKQGMRQDFIVKEKPSGDDDLRLIMNVSTNLNMNVRKDAVTFISKKDGTEKMQYASLKVSDAKGKKLDAYFEKKNPKQFSICVNDKNAEYPVTIDPLSSSPEWVVTSDQSLSRFGDDGVSCGDINGDGFEDVVIGADCYEPYPAVFIYYGSQYGPSVIADKILYGESIGYGVRVCCKGDYNADGYNDLVIGDPWFNGNGRVVVHYGSAAGVADAPNWIGTRPAGIFEEYGFTVSTAGDVNGDDYSDLIVGVYNQLVDSHYVNGYVYLGSINGLSGNNPAWTTSTPSDILYYGFSFCISDAGDINNDGYDDVISAANGGGYVPGHVFIYFGAANKGMFEPADIVLTQNFINFGYSVSTAGDINSDGFDDIVIGGSLYGGTFVYYGSQYGLNLNFDVLGIESNKATSAGDFNDDGYDDIITSNYYISNLYLGSDSGIGTIPVIINDGANSLSSGDINGDGISDIVIGKVPSVNGFFGSADKVSILSIYPKDTILIANTGSEVCLSSLVKSQYEFPMSGVTIDFIVKGANPGSGSSVSGSNGFAWICFVGNFAGSDTVIANASGTFDTAFVFWDFPSPVELSSFNSSVRGRNVTLNWFTSSELNNSGFNIERSSVNNQWMNAGFVSGHGTISEPVEYSFTEKNLTTGKYKYRLKQIDFNGNFEYFELAEEVSIGIPDKYELSQNYPNPFNPVTNLEFGISNLEFVTLKIYDVLGRELVTLVNEIKEPGYFKIKFDAGNLSSGVYFYRMEAGDFVAVKKFVVMK
ncbi:MAG: FG-GAP repeat protein [Ignavibacteria bacterium]|nr:FG-GAP repeat protein [Ignavibacteria bacterium]